MFTTQHLKGREKRAREGVPCTAEVIGLGGLLSRLISPVSTSADELLCVVIRLLEEADWSELHAVLAAWRIWPKRTSEQTSSASVQARLWPS
jgi:hypothetical protein